jgi:CubicO group peptidase (beta-lactamase class C family)
MKKLLFLSLITLTFTANTQSILPKENLDKVIKFLIKKHKIPNAVVAISHKDSIVYTYTTPENSIHDVFLIGSNTKSFTALSILQLVDKGLIDLDKPVSHYLTWFSFPNETTDKKISVRNLLNQTSGLPTWGGFYDYLTLDFEVFQQKFAAYLKTLPAVNLIGEQFQYCNANYVLLGLIIQKVSGETYPDYVKKHIFEPLKMRESHAYYKSATAYGLIDGYQYAYLSPIKSATRPYSDFIVSEGHIASTANDMMLYLQGIMKNKIKNAQNTDGTSRWNIPKQSGDTREGGILSEKSYQTMLKPEKDGYAMGWGETHYSGQKVIQHLGLNENFNSALFVMPQQEYSVITLANINSMEFSGEVKEAIILTLLNKPFEDHPSLDKAQRIATLSVLILTFLGFLFQFYRWWKKGFKIGKPSIFSIIRFIFFSILSLIPLYIVPKIGNIPLKAMMHHAPDYAYGFIGIAVLGVLAALMRMLRRSPDLG